MALACLLIAATAAEPLRAQEGPALSDLVSETRRHWRSLSEFVGTRSPISIEGGHSGIEVEIALSPRIELLGGEVMIQHEHAATEPGLAPGLRISWDDREIGTALLSPGERRGRLAGRLPGLEAPVSSYRLKIASRQEGLPGTGSESPIPITQIDTLASGLALEYQLRPLDPLLDQLRDLIDDRFWGDYALTLVTPPLYSLEARHLDWGNRVAQRSAIWMGKRPLEIRHSDRLTSLGDEIAIGTRAELIGILPKTICDQISNSFVGVYPHPRDPRHFLLVLSGTEPEGVTQAVRAFTIAPEQFPGLPRIDVTGWQIAETPAAGREAITGRRVTLPDLDLWRREGLPGAVTGGFDLWVGSRDAGSVSSAWMLAGKLAQTAGDLQPMLGVVDTMPAGPRHWLAIGPISALEPAVVDASTHARVSVAEGEGFLTQFQSPEAAGIVGGVLCAADHLILRERVIDLIHPIVWESLRGDTSVWHAGDQEPRNHRLAVTFEVGSPGLAAAVWHRVTGLPWLSVLLCTVSLVILGWLLRQPMTSGRDWDLVPARANANRRTSRSRRQRENARRQARLEESLRRGV